ncbi:hypothetical protein PIB30_086056 [Stylosanthes scabra]|uniref:Uncharacterized protein n=1 Tax=Stylosanthes scabra TaxID=79078 RepID=A0ABU6STL0_9FABA|nr:hypothetical protein [Stylosanthes scabra]
MVPATVTAAQAHRGGRRHRVWQRAASREVTVTCCFRLNSETLRPRRNSFHPSAVACCSQTAPEVLCSLHGIHKSKSKLLCACLHSAPFCW